MGFGRSTVLVAVLVAAPLASAAAQDARRGRQTEAPAPRREERPEPRRAEPEQRRSSPQAGRRDDGGSERSQGRTERPAPPKSTGDPELRRRKP